MKATGKMAAKRRKRLKNGSFLLRFLRLFAAIVLFSQVPLSLPAETVAAKAGHARSRPVTAIFGMAAQRLIGIQDVGGAVLSWFDPVRVSSTQFD
jgi:hypothetical protein